MVERDPQKAIEEINQTINTIVSDVEWEVTIILSEENDLYTAYQLAKESWPRQVNIPTSKDEAIIILDDPESTRLDKLGASLFAEIYKKRQLQKASGIKPKQEGSLVLYIFDSD